MAAPRVRWAIDAVGLEGPGPLWFFVLGFADCRFGQSESVPVAFDGGLPDRPGFGWIAGSESVPDTTRRYLKKKPCKLQIPKKTSTPNKLMQDFGNGSTCDDVVHGVDVGG